MTTKTKCKCGANHVEEENRKLRKALLKIVELEEFRHGSGVVDYRPLLSATAMYDIAYNALLEE